MEELSPIWVDSEDITVSFIFFIRLVEFPFVVGFEKIVSDWERIVWIGGFFEAGGNGGNGAGTIIPSRYMLCK